MPFKLHFHYHPTAVVIVERKKDSIFIYLFINSDHILSKGHIVLLEWPLSLCLSCYVNNPLLGQIHCFRREDKHPYLMILFVPNFLFFLKGAIPASVLHVEQ